MSSKQLNQAWIVSFPTLSAPELQWLFVKCCSKDNQLTEWADFKVAFSNEGEGYKHLEDLDLPLTKCYLAQQDIIVLKDLVSQGYKMADKYQGYSLAQAEIVLGVGT